MDSNNGKLPRTVTEEIEDLTLSPYACKSTATKGRKVYESPCDIRTEFQRDRDRIIHCNSFRRLKHKTQVFLAPEGDHYRTRLTHTLEVSQIARSIARALRLNEDLTEAIALVVDAWKRQGSKRERPLSAEDLAGLQNVVSYISDHYAFDIPLARLAGIACMSESKLKTCFKRQLGCTVTQYIQGRRMSQAEHLLIHTDFTMGQIAQMIGYTTSSRFAELFKKSTGLLPMEYRRLATEGRQR